MEATASSAPGEGGDVGYAGNAGQDAEAIGEARVGFDNLEDCGLDYRDLPIDRFEALSILTLQQRERQNFSAALGGGSILHQGLASDVKVRPFEQDLASGWACLQFQQCADAASRRSVLASLPSPQRIGAPGAEDSRIWFCFGANYQKGRLIELISSKGAC